MAHQMTSERTASPLRSRVVELLSALARRCPGYVLRIAYLAFTPNVFVRKVVLVSVLQLIASLIKQASRFRWHLVGLSRPATALRRSETLSEWQAAEREFHLRAPEEPMPHELFEYCKGLDERANNYLQMMEAGDMHGLMFHLRSELSRSQVGGTGYSRDGNVSFRKNRKALQIITQSQEKVISALRYISSGGEASPSETPLVEAPSIAERLAFIKETRQAYGRTALLLSGGAAFGFKHGGVLQALNEQGLLPHIISGTSAGSIAAAAVCVCDADEVTARVNGGFFAHVVRTTFFGVRPQSQLDLAQHDAVALAHPRQRASTGSGRLPEAMSIHRRGSVPDLTDLSGGMSPKRLIRNAARSGGTRCLDQGILIDAVLPLVGELTFLEAFDVSRRILNVVVTRSDGKAAPLMCNYLTTPQMLVYSACVASCAIPGVYEPVELLAKDREGRIVPYFKTGGWRWTDGSLQADLPKQRLSELFNCNQFIVSQVNPYAPLFNPVDSGLPLLTDMLRLIKAQLVGFAEGASQLWGGRLARPAGVRLVDVLLQDYEGDVTLMPDWRLHELLEFVKNFDAERMLSYELDGKRAVWPKLPMIRSLCEVELELERISMYLEEQLALERALAVEAASASSAHRPRASSTSLGDEPGTLRAVRQRPSYSEGLADLEHPSSPQSPPKVSTSIRQPYGLLQGGVAGSGGANGGGATIWSTANSTAGDAEWEGHLDSGTHHPTSREGAKMPASSSYASLLSLGIHAR